VAVPPQGHLRHHQDPLPLLVLHNGTYLQLKSKTMHASQLMGMFGM
jgi:hypothetical protein